MSEKSVGITGFRLNSLAFALANAKKLKFFNHNMNPVVDSDLHYSTKKTPALAFDLEWERTEFESNRL